MFVTTHSDLYARKPNWRELDRQTGAYGAGVCAGSFYVEDTTDRVWAAVCDKCGDEYGIPPKDQPAVLEAAVRFGS